MAAATDPSIRGVFRQPFKEQVDFFRKKLNLPTERYDDIRKSAHDRAFIVAGAAKADLLNDLRDAVDKAIRDGESIGKFRDRFRGIVNKHGWHGWIGEGSKKGEAWRTRVIYQTNLTQSYNAGRYQQLNDPDLVKRRPYWKYIHNDTVSHPRPLHVSWSGLVLHKDDPWWQAHFPPNGWGCRCRVTAVRPSEYKGDKAPDGWYLCEGR
ncbi:Phage head morphogenesis protein, SPP1 gp7 (fragment) [Nitrosomonas nitrosa]|uniref:Phage head morphogenesis protein, SPP1 gp7 n=1 Tax=Nitrosomonas nitrosa TaxID=52442 RepID=A0A8H9D9U7_9PROT